MNRNIALLLIIFLIFPYFAYSVTTFVIQETEKISLKTNATDPDNDRLTYTYSPPLDENGEWQTTYGDAGEYKSQVTVSDGLANTSQEILVVVKRKEEAPTIDLYAPESPVYMKEMETAQFKVEASDLNKDELSYEWYLDSKKTKDGTEFTYTPSYIDSGKHTVFIIVSDGIFKASKTWDVYVEDVDVQKLLDGISDVTVNENEIARLDLPDFAKYGLTYTITQPIGDDNEWQTGYDDAGAYDVIVHAEGNGFSGNTIVKVSLNDVDRPPIFDEIGSKVINENQTIVINLSAHDPDGDEIDYSADKLPEGAEMENSIFIWTPSFDTVRKEDFIDYIANKFTILNENFYIQFSASSKDKKVVQNVVVTVKDVNRAPVIEDMSNITVNEGDTIKIEPDAYDLDGDKVKLSYSGFMDSGTYKTTYDDAGTYFVKVTATDGAISTSKFADINVRQTNRAPIFNPIKEIKVQEGDAISISLNAYDPDEDQLSYYLSNPPEDSSIDGNVFIWTPGFDTVNKQDTKRFDLVFVATDGSLEARQNAIVDVTGKNRAPVIINASSNLVAKVNEPVFMFVKAEDDDGDSLTYTWDFGLLEKYEATENHQRTFTTSGNKVIKVTVSDGIDSVEHVINVFVEDDSKAINGSITIAIKKVKITIINETQVYQSNLVQSEEFQAPAQSAVNRAPKITAYSNSVVAKVNQPVLLFVKAIDPDNDPLTYTWDFGFFDKYKTTTPNNLRTFTSKGLKTVVVTVTDGQYKVKQLINVNVV